jgi:hypothetical protein
MAMLHVSRSIKCLFLIVAISVSFMGLNSSANAAVYCDPESPYSDWIGFEYVFQNCVPDVMNDNINPDNYNIVYNINSIGCSNHTVVLADNSGGDTWWENPSMIISKYAGYRVFRNKEGTHIVVLSDSYDGHIGGTSEDYDMGNFSAGVHTDFFKEMFLTPGSVPNCMGSEPNNPPMESCASSTVNMATGRLSHSQEVFSLGGSPLPLSVDLYYRSTPFAPSSIGNGWSHNYEATLQTGTGYGMVLPE